jgi:hypothetical protein
MGGDSTSSHVEQRAAKRKYGATWTRMTPIQQAIYEDMQSNAGELKPLQPLTKQKTHQRLMLQ